MSKTHNNHHRRRKSGNGAVPEALQEKLAEFMPIEEHLKEACDVILEYFENPAKEDAKRWGKWCIDRTFLFVQRHSFAEYRKMFVAYESLEDFIVDLNGSWQMRFRLVMAGCSSGCIWTEASYKYIIDRVCNWMTTLTKENPALAPELASALHKVSKKHFHEQQYPAWIMNAADALTEEAFANNFAMSRDSLNVRLYEEYDRTTMIRLALRAATQQMIAVIPEHYTDLFPMARKLHRKFILHVGPTNSGKTYDALNALKASGGGIYLAPLRLLAFEKYTELTEAGLACSLLTGEERITCKGATYQASTIEMADFEVEYPCAVIDEAQMLEDDSRGCRWTAAILGICSPQIHVCMAPHAVELVIRLINECGDSYEIVQHTRNTELLVDSGDFSFPEDVESGDALIVFSRKNVHVVASELKMFGMKASLIYGSLPYDVRQEQAKLFREKENDIVVATDAIGMGVNLPIKRVVLLETEKFDGTRKRKLHAGEIQQIVGRAGRFGMYDEGYYTCQGEGNSAERKSLAKSVRQELPPLKTAYVSFPETLLDIKLPVSALLKKWDAMEKRDGYITSFVMRDRSLALHLERYADDIKELDVVDDRRMIYSFAVIPFNEDNQYLYEIWSATFAHFAKYHELDEDIVKSNMDFDYTSSELDYLENCSQMCDLFYQLVLRTDGGDDMIEFVLEEKRKVSDRIIEILDAHEYAGKKCKRCQATLAFDYQFGYCERCFAIIREQRSRHAARRGRR